MKRPVVTPQDAGGFAIAWALFWLILILAIGLVLPSIAHCQRADHGLDLARAVVHEAGFDATPDEVAAMHAVAVARCAGSMRCQMPRFFAGRTTRAWAQWLRRDATRPWGWPEFVTRQGRRDPSRVRLVAHAPWSHYRDRWLALLEVADRVVAGELAASCSPEAWGGAVDRARARRLRLVEIDCGETRNAFYRFPGSAR